MLPGFRFLFAAIVLSMSILVFGLGAAALLRAAHEEFASNPSWHVPPEAKFAQPRETTAPTLTMLRVEPPAAAEQEAAGNVPAVETPPEPATASAPVEPEKVTALTSEDSSPPEAAKPEIAVPDSPSHHETAPAAQAETPAVQAETAVADPRPAAEEATTAMSEQASPPTPVPTPPTEAVPAASEPASAASESGSEQASTPAASEPDPGSTKIATLGGPPVTIETTPPSKAASAKTVSAKPDKSAIKKRQQARQAARRRKTASRAPVARQVADPFAQQLVQPAAPARSR